MRAEGGSGTTYEVDNKIEEYMDTGVRGSVYNYCKKECIEQRDLETNADYSF